MKAFAASDHRTEAFVVDEHATPEQIEAAAARLARDPQVEYAAPEYRRKAHKLTTDPLLLQQWYLVGDQPAATHTDSAWDVTEGSASVIVAVLDTGILDTHPDLQGKLLPGRDFVSDLAVANDGDGRDDDPRDPGDWVTRADVDRDPNDALDEECLDEAGRDIASSWHGTRVASLIGAHTNNAAGMAGNAWNTRILPVRVLGKCGGADRDIVDAIRWAAGFPVDGRINPNPAQIINLSLGGDSPCTSAYQSVIAEVASRGVLIVASAGNDGRQANAPANCTGVVGVAGLRHTGTKVGFSNLGPQVDLSAPGGNCVNASGTCLFSIVVATNTGTTAPVAHGYSDALNFNVGTSFSAPMAASAAALLKAVNPTLTPAQTLHLLKATATPFPSNPAVRTCTIPTDADAPQDSECNCTPDTCGAGMLNTGAAVLAALGPLAVLQIRGSVVAGATLDIDARDSFGSEGRTIVGHQWSISNVTGAIPQIANPGAAATTLHIPGESQFTLRLTVTDDQGTQDTRQMSLAISAQPSAPTAPAPPNTSNSVPSSGGGGGALGWEWLALTLLWARGRRRRAH